MIRTFALRFTLLFVSVALIGVLRDGSAGAAPIKEFDGAWRGSVTSGGCRAVRTGTELTGEVREGRFKLTAGRKLLFDTEVRYDGMVSAPVLGSFWGMKVIGRFRGDRFLADVHQQSCSASLELARVDEGKVAPPAAAVRPAPEPATTADSGGTAAAPPAPEPATPRAAGLPSAPATTLATVPAAPQAAALTRFDGVWAGKVSECDTSKDVEVQVENGRFVYEGRVGRVTRFEGRIDEITGDITGLVTQGKGYSKGARALKGRARGNTLSARGQTWSCWAEIILVREGPPPAQVALAPTSRAMPPPRPGPSPGPRTTRPAPVAAAAAADKTPPVIEVPADITADGAVVEIAGRVTDRSLIGEVTIDGRPIPVAADGSFSVQRVVPVGTSSMRVAALDEWGNRAETGVSVTRKPATVAPAKTRVSAARDTAAPVIDVPAALETDKTVVTLAGKVTDASRVVELTLDGRPLTLDGDGGFSARREVALGASVLKLAAVDEWGNRSEQPVQVTRLTAAEALGIDFGRYHALVIGNDDYQDLPNLQTAVADARAVANALRQDYGFEVNLLENATGYEIKSSISRLRRTLTEKDNLLVYYAGHGVVDKEVEAGFWLPVDAERDSDANWIANSYLSRNLRALNAKHVMVVADSCYSGTLVRAAPVQLRSARERTAWLERMAAKRSRTALVSGGLEPVMDSGGGSHSVFAKAFLAALADNDGVLDGQSLFEKVERPVILSSDQTPDYADIRRAGHEGGEFLFVRR